MSTQHAGDPCEGVDAGAKRPRDAGSSSASASGVPAPSCLCVKEGHAGVQTVGTFRNGVFVPHGLIPCNICDGTAISPRARKDGVTVPSEPPLTDALDDIESLLDGLLA